jgi:hypothetical protein
MDGAQHMREKVKENAIAAIAAWCPAITSFSIICITRDNTIRYPRDFVEATRLTRLRPNLDAMSAWRGNCQSAENKGETRYAAR